MSEIDGLRAENERLRAGLARATELRDYWHAETMSATRRIAEMHDDTAVAPPAPADAFAAASCPYGVGPGDGSGCIKPAGHDRDHVVTAGVPVMPCSRAELQQPHIPHSWWPQPGMAYVHCPGMADEAQQDKRVKHSGPDAEFCVLCLSGEHERKADEAQQAGEPGRG